MGETMTLHQSKVNTIFAIMITVLSFTIVVQEYRISQMQNTISLLVKFAETVDKWTDAATKSILELRQKVGI
jgi:hypothetical protein